MTSPALGMSRSARGRLGAYASWGNTADRSARTAAARSGLLARFEREAREALGPDASDRAVAEAAEARKKAYYQRLAASGVKARKKP